MRSSSPHLLEQATEAHQMGEEHEKQDTSKDDVKNLPETSGSGGLTLLMTVIALAMSMFLVSCDLSNRSFILIVLHALGLIRHGMICYCPSFASHSKTHNF